MLAVRRRPVLAGIVLVLLVVVLIFGGRAAWRLGVRLLGPPPPPRQTDVEQIADWMSIPYISRAYRVPRQELFMALGLPADGRERRSVRDLAEESGRSPDELLEIIRETVLAWQATHPDVPGPPGRGKPKPGGDGSPPGGPQLERARAAVRG